MKAENFLYWLQGYFELTSERDVLDRTQVQIIDNHMILVFEKNPEPTEVGLEFVIWLRGFLDFNRGNQLEIANVNTLREKLNKFFLHVVDPLDGGQEIQDKLNEIHNMVGMSDEDYIKKHGYPPSFDAIKTLHGWVEKGDELMRC